MNELTDSLDYAVADLVSIQQQFTGVQYIITDEMSMVGRKLFGSVDQRLWQAFPHHANIVLGGCSCLLISHFGQLPPALDLPQYTSTSSSSHSDLGRTTDQCFDKAVALDEIMCHSGANEEQAHFCSILLRLCNAELTIANWQCLMTHLAAQSCSKF